jgi:hypothetical protein
MPEGQDLDHLVVYEPVVEEIVDTVEMEPTYSLDGNVEGSYADPGLRRNEVESSLQFLPEQTARCRAVLAPPVCRLADLLIGVGGDEQPKPQA